MSEAYPSDLKNDQVEPSPNLPERNGQPIFRTNSFFWVRILFLAILGLVGGRVNAQASVIVDLEVRLQISPDSYVPPGTMAYVDVEIINHGPGTAIGPEVNSSTFYDWLPALGREAGFWIRPTPSTPPCAMYYHSLLYTSPSHETIRDI